MMEEWKGGIVRKATALGSLELDSGNIIKGRRMGR
jgi:hypothetical protein